MSNNEQKEEAKSVLDKIDEKPEPGSDKVDKPEKKSQQVKILEQEVEKLRFEADDFKALAIRLQADFENYKKRNKTVATDMYNEGIADAFAAIVPVLESFDHAEQNAKDEHEKEGLALIKKQFSEVLAKYSVEELGNVGEEFNPSIHNAMMQVQPEKPEDAGKVLAVFNKGYRIGEKVLKYALVQVGAGA